MSRLDDLRLSINSKKILLDKAKENNRRREELLNKHFDTQRLMEDAKNYQTDIESIRNATIAEYSNYRNERLDFLSNNITNILNNVFEDDYFQMKMSVNNQRGIDKLSIKISKNNSKFTNPKNSSGGLSQQLISFSSSMSIVEILGKSIFYIDEAFNNSSEDNKPKLGAILNNFVQKGYQIFLISQGSSLYENIPRRELRLKYENKEAVLVGVEDKGE